MTSTRPKPPIPTPSSGLAVPSVPAQSKLSFSEPPLQRKFRLTLLNSIGSRLFLYVLSGALVGLGSMSYFFYQVLETRAETEIQSTLSTQVNLIDGQLLQSEQTVNDLIAAVKSLQAGGVQDAKVYKNLAFEFFKKRPSLTVGIGFGQGPYKIITNRQWYWPYFYEDQGSALPDAVGVLMPPPYENTRDSELAQYDNYQNTDYYKDYVLPQRKTRPEPYAWAGTTLASLYIPIFDDKNRWLGVAANDINVTTLTQKIDGSVSQDAGYFAILSVRGNLIAYPPDPAKVKSLESYQQVPELRAVWPQLQQGTSGLVQSGGSFWAYRRIPTTDWLMIAVVPQSKILGPLWGITVVGTLGAAVVLAAMVTLFVRWLNRRLQPILDECNRLATADTQTEAQLENQDEIERLSTSFFNLVAQVAANEELIRQEVARSVQTQERLKQASESERESEVLQEEVGHLLDVVSAVEDGDLTVQAQVSDRATGLVADTLNRLIEQLAQVLTGVLGTAQQVSGGAEELEALAQIVAVNAERQAEAVVQVQKLTEQVEHSALHSAQQVGLTTRSLGSVQVAVGQGQEAIDQLTRGIDVLQQGSAQIVQRMKTLGEFVGLADQFVQDQGQIASLTQVLAINATLVAARAAEQRDPRQFIVVAREFEAIATQVSTLAAQTNEGLGVLQQRTSQIHAVVSAIDADVQSLSGLVAGFNAGVGQSGQVFNNVQVVTAQVQQVGQQVTQSSQEIVSASRSTAQSVRDISGLAERTAELTRASRLQAERMENLARHLLGSIQFFRLPSLALPDLQNDESEEQRINLAHAEVNTLNVAAEAAEEERLKDYILTNSSQVPAPRKLP